MSLMRNSLLGLLILAQVFVWTACESDDSDGSVPGISITSPEDGAVIRLSTVITAEVVSEKEISFVVFSVDGNVIDTLFAPPFETSLGSAFSELGSGSHDLTALAEDVDGHAGESEPVSITVFSDNIIPSVALTAPAENAVLTAFTEIQVDAQDNDAVGSVSFYIDETLIGQSAEPPFSFGWNILNWADDEPHNISVQAADLSGNVSNWDSYSVTVSDNADVYPTLSAPAEGVSISDDVSIEFVWRVFPNSNGSYVVPNGMDYTFEISSSPSFTPVIFTDTVFDTTVTYGISANGMYYWRVMAHENGTDSDWSPSQTFEIVGRPEVTELQAPAHQTVLDQTTTVYFEWEATENSDVYEIQISESSEFGVLLISEELTAISVSYSDFEQNTYYWRVRGKNSAGFYGDFSDVYEFSIDGPVAPNILAPYPGQNWNVSSPAFNGAVMKWSPQSGYDDSYYQLRIGSDEDLTDVVFSTDADTSVYTVTTLSTGYYYWNVRECNLFDICGDWSYTGYFDLTGPNVPAHIIPENNSVIYDTNQPEFQYSDVEYATQFVVHVFNDVFSVEETSTATDLTLNTPLDQGEYYWQVKSGSEHDVFSSWSIPDTLNIDGPPFPIMTYPGDNETINDTNTPTLTWDAAPNAVEYHLMVSSEISFSDTLEETTTQDLEYMTGVLPAENYYWKVQAMNEYDFWGPYSSPFSFRIAGPDSPEDLLPANHTVIRDRVDVDFSWSTPDDITTDYKFELTADYNFITIDQTIITTENALSLELSKGQYYWRVSARNIYDMWGALSDQYDVTVNGPEIPLMLTPADNSIETATSQLTFSWEPADDFAVSWDLVVSANRFFTDIELEETISAAEYTVAMPQGNHYWKIRGTNEPGVHGDWSEIWQVEIDGPLAPEIVAPEFDAEIADASPEFHWTASENAVSYHVELSRDDDFDIIEINSTVPDTMLSLTGLDEGWWFWRVAAENANGLTGDWSDSRFYNGINPVSVIGGAGNDLFRNGLSTWDDGFVFMGETESFGGGGKDGLLTKVYANGAEAWTIPFGNSFENNIFGGALTTDGGMIFVGQSYNHDGSDAWLLKTNSAGQLEWEGAYGGLEYDKGNAVVENDDGTFTFAGGTYSSGSGLSDIYLARLNQNDNIAWSRTFGTADIDWAHDLKMTFDGGYIVLGYTKEELSSHTDIIVIRTDSSGEEIWRYVYDSGYTDFGYTIEHAGDGGYVICGYSEMNGDTDLLLIKIDGAGNEVWTQHYGGSRDERGYGVAVSDAGDFYAAGYTESYGLGSLKNGWVIQVDNSGQMLWSQTYGGYEDDELLSIRKTADGGFCACGHTRSLGMGGTDAWYLKINANNQIEY